MGKFHSYSNTVMELVINLRLLDICSNVHIQILKIKFERGYICLVYLMLLTTQFRYSHKAHYLWSLFFGKALKTKYFSNRPGPTPGCQLPRPNCPAEALKEQSNPAMATKRKRTEALEQGKTLIFLHAF